ncbi:MAG: GNAT family N-acetyltransferase, partial [Acidobacteriaceae bacterium]|nr:GNAT family N-acetyltransferase [Acidobacteriaceae bacterium]
YLDPLIDAPCGPEFLSQLQEHLQRTPGWQVCDWQDLAADTPLRELPGSAASDQVPCTIIPLRGTFESFWSARSADLRRNLRRYIARAEESGQIAFEAVDGPNPELLEHLIRLHTRRWRAHGEPGMVAVHRLAPFLREIVARLSLDGMVRYFLIRFSGEIAAILVAFIHRNEVFAYMSAFDPEYESFGFGRKLLYESLRTSYESGHSVWNFLRGDEPYKLSWGAELMPRCRIRLER